MRNVFVTLQRKVFVLDTVQESPIALAVLDTGMVVEPMPQAQLPAGSTAHYFRRERLWLGGRNNGFWRSVHIATKLHNAPAIDVLLDGERWCSPEDAFKE